MYKNVYDSHVTVSYYYHLLYSFLTFISKGTNTHTHKYIRWVTLLMFAWFCINMAMLYIIFNMLFMSQWMRNNERMLEKRRTCLFLTFISFHTHIIYRSKL